jgi:hypothetical protein
MTLSNGTPCTDPCHDQVIRLVLGWLGADPSARVGSQLEMGAQPGLLASQ